MNDKITLRTYLVGKKIVKSRCKKGKEMKKII